MTPSINIRRTTFLSQKRPSQEPPLPPTANPCRAGILSQYFSPTDILLERFGGKIWKRHSEGGDKWQVIHIKGLKQNRYFLRPADGRWSKPLRFLSRSSWCAPQNFTLSYSASFVWISSSSCSFCVNFMQLLLWLLNWISSFDFTCF